MTHIQGLDYFCFRRSFGLFFGFPLGFRLIRTCMHWVIGRDMVEWLQHVHCLTEGLRIWEIDDRFFSFSFLYNESTLYDTSVINDRNDSQ